jgi:peptidoglycan/LPS O-acetylase OafA/YrhL
LLGLVLSFVLAALSFRYLETPALRLKRRFGSSPATVRGETGA